jgi:hypothetical protein
MELRLGKAAQDRKDLVHMSLAAEEALQPVPRTVEMKGQREIAPKDIK